MYCPTVDYIRPRGHPFRRIAPVLLSHTHKLSTEDPLVTTLIYSPGRRVLRTSKRPEPANLVHCPSCDRHEPFCYSRRHRPTPKNTLRGNPGCAVGPKTPTIIEVIKACLVQFFLTNFSENLAVRRIWLWEEFEYHYDYVWRKIKLFIRLRI